MGPEDLVGESFDVLLIDDICSFLTPRLVARVKSSGREVVGVFDPAEFADGKERLLECGVSDVVEADAHPDEFLRVISRVAQHVVTTTLTDGGAGDPVIPEVPEPRMQKILAVGGPAGGTGSTEVAIAIACRLGEAGRRVVLIDADEVAPSIAQRLSLSIHPNLRTAIDIMEHRTGPLTSVTQRVGDIAVIAGLPNVSDWSEVRPTQVTDLIEDLSAVFDHVVVNVGSHLENLGFGGASDRFGISRRTIAGADRAIAVSLPNPVGVGRTLGWLAEAQRLRTGAPIDLLINRAPRDQFRRGELIEEITRSYQPASFGFVPTDEAVTRAAWDGVVVNRGRFKRALDRWVDRFVPEVAA
jgi:MinD-like ATPase involved in chromosome partitioning or flagellar assembly